MTISVDWENRIIESTASITDLPAFHASLRDEEDSATGMIYPVTHTWKALDLGGGAFFYQADLINSYQLKLIGSGPFQISGNLNGSIIDTGVQVERKTSAAYTTTAIGGTSASPSDIASAVWSHTTGASVAVRLAEAWGRLGLDASKPLVSDQASITFGDIVMALTGNEVASTLTRQ